MHKRTRSYTASCAHAAFNFISHGDPPLGLSIVFFKAPPPSPPKPLSQHQSTYLPGARHQERGSWGKGGSGEAEKGKFSEGTEGGMEGKGEQGRQRRRIGLSERRAGEK